MRTKLFLFGLLLIGLQAADEGRAGDETLENTRLGLIAGAPAASETVLAADIANLLSSDAQLRVLPMVGDAGIGNIAHLLDDPRVDVGVVSTDALASAEQEVGGSFKERLELIAKLYPQEVHVVARSEIKSLADLAGKQVNYGPEGSNSAVTAAALFEALSIAVEPVKLDTAAGIERLAQGRISAAVIVGGTPMPAISAIAAGSGAHLVPIPFGAPLETAYLPTRLTHRDYPNLIPEGGEVPTVATGTILLAATGKGDATAPARIARFVEGLFARFAELQAPDRHPKWREVNLAAMFPGLKRAAAAEAWLAAHPVTPGTQMASSSGADSAPAPLPQDSNASNDEKEALFRRFMEWKRANGH